MKLIQIIIIAIIVLLAGCIPPEQPDYSSVNIDFHTPSFCEIATFKDKSLVDSLVKAFDNSDPSIRYQAARAFASIQSEEDIPELATLLDDPVIDVSAMAAYAIGQQKSIKGEYRLQNAFRRNDTLSRYTSLNKAILEATGKCGGKENLENLASVSTYFKSDTSLLMGQALGIYRYMQRDITSEAGTAKMIEFATDKNIHPTVRMLGANYLARASFGNIDEKLRKSLINSLKETKNPEIRMNLFLAVGKLKTDEARQEILNVFDQAGDFREKCNAIRSLANFEYASIQEVPFKALKDKNKHVRHTAANFFIKHGSPQDGSLYFRMARDSQYQDIKVQLLHAACRNVPPYFKDTHWTIFNELKKIFESSQSDLVKADVVRAMGGNIWNYRKIWEFAHQDTLPPVVKTAAVAALASIFELPNLRTLYGQSYNRVLREVSGYVAEAINNGDVGEVVEAANLIANTPDIVPEYENSSFLYAKQRVLKLPQEIEAHHALQKAINTFEGTDKPLKQLDYNHPFECDFLKKYYTPLLANVKTTKGDFTIKLLPNTAPATVANFIQLAQSGYYKNKYFHRIVPNFVTQGGCNRGDGYSATDYSIRSEFSPIYYHQQGMVGMASAGPNTESAQFFVTHGPTPHLDGRYTIFGQIQEGMDVVFDLERGDRIKEVEIEGASPPEENK